MAKTALMFGSIGSVIETSDIQRRGLQSRPCGRRVSTGIGTRDTYADLLTQAGGKERLVAPRRGDGSGICRTRRSRASMPGRLNSHAHTWCRRASHCARVWRHW